MNTGLTQAGLAGLIVSAAQAPDTQCQELAPYLKAVQPSATLIGLVIAAAGLIVALPAVDIALEVGAVPSVGKI